MYRLYMDKGSRMMHAHGWMDGLADVIVVSAHLLCRHYVMQRDFLALRRTRTCKGRTHRTDTICATCSLIRKGNKEMFKVCSPA